MPRFYRARTYGVTLTRPNLLMLSNGTTVRGPHERVPMVPGSLLVRDRYVVSRNRPFGEAFLVPRLYRHIVTSVRRPRVIFELPFRGSQSVHAVSTRGSVVFYVRRTNATKNITEHRGHFSNPATRVGRVSIVGEVPEVTTLDKVIKRRFRRFFLVRVQTTGEPAELGVRATRLIMVYNTRRFFRVLIVFFNALPVRQVRVS